MSQFFQIHPENPQLRLLRQAAQLLHQGCVAVVPTDSCFALVCHLDDKESVSRLRKIRQIDERHHLALLCRDLSEISVYAKVDNTQYRLLKSATPGPFTFILEATKEVPRKLSHPSRKTIGLRIPDDTVIQALLSEFGAPLISTSLILPGETFPQNDIETIKSKLGKLVDLIVDGGPCTVQPTTVVDLTSSEPIVLRVGRGDLGKLGK